MIGYLADGRASPNSGEMKWKTRTRCWTVLQSSSCPLGSRSRCERPVGASPEMTSRKSAEQWGGRGGHFTRLLPTGSAPLVVKTVVSQVSSQRRLKKRLRGRVWSYTPKKPVWDRIWPYRPKKLVWNRVWSSTPGAFSEVTPEADSCVASQQYLSKII